MTEPTTYADGPTAAVDTLANGISAASGGAVTAGFGYGITSDIPNENTPSYTLDHRYGTALDLHVNGSASYLEKVADWFEASPAVVEVVVFADTSAIHVTLGDVSSVDLSGFPKTTRKKADVDDEAAE